MSAASESETISGEQSKVRRDEIRSLSIVIPILNESGNIPNLYAALVPQLDSIGLPWELIFIDDGSADTSWDIVIDLAANDTRVSGLRHRKNFGKAQSLSHGFSAARGDVVITMDGDLQDDPVELPNFLTLIADGNDLVSGWKQHRQDPVGKTFPSKIFNRVVRQTTGVHLHDFNCGFKAYRHEVTQNIRLYGELHRFTPVLANAEGFRIAELPVQHHPRQWGQSKYGWGRLAKGFLDLLTVIFITRFRERPMHLFGVPGIIFMLLGSVFGFWLGIEKFINHEAIGGRPMLMLAVLLFVVGAQFFGLGLLAEYLSFGNNAPEHGKSLPLRATVGLDNRPDFSVRHSGSSM